MTDEKATPIENEAGFNNEAVTEETDTATADMPEQLEESEYDDFDDED